MFTHNNSQLPHTYYDHSSDFPNQFQFPFPHPLTPDLASSSTGCSNYYGPEAYSSMATSPPSYFEPVTSPVIKPLSAGDSQGANMAQHYQRSNSLLASESSIIESMSRTSPYSPEEKKERIERYRSKRNLRNFNKKIKYECRKTLADSRPRIKGRFARNDEIEKTPQSQWDSSVMEEYYKDDDNWVNFLDPFSANLMP